MTITSARIEGIGHAKVFGMIDGQEILLFAYYTDELSFAPHEFVGLTLDQARELHFRRDVAYLQS